MRNALVVTERKTFYLKKSGDHDVLIRSKVNRLLVLLLIVVILNFQTFMFCFTCLFVIDVVYFVVSVMGTYYFLFGSSKTYHQ